MIDEAVSKEDWVKVAELSKRFREQDLGGQGKDFARIEGNARFKIARRRSMTDESHEDYKKAHTPKSIKSMSDAELRNRLNRLQMERQYSQLSESSVNKGKEYAQKVFKAGTTVAAVTTTALTIYNTVYNFSPIFDPTP